MYCKNCGQKLSEKAVFCGNCGAPVTRPKKSEGRPVWFWIAVALLPVAVLAAVGYIIWLVPRPPDSPLPTETPPAKCESLFESSIRQQKPDWQIVDAPQSNSDECLVVDENGRTLNCEFDGTSVVCLPVTVDPTKQLTVTTEATLTPLPSPRSTAEPPTAAPTATAGPDPTPESVESVKSSNIDGMRQLLVEEGSFLIGAGPGDAQAGDNERPQQEIYLDSFWIDETEVTNAQFAQFLNDLGSHQRACSGQRCMKTNEEDGFSHIGRSGSQYVVESDFENHPMIMVTWDGAAAYCQWAGRRLPTEAEWEKAARGEDGRLYPWGNQFAGNEANWCEASCSANHGDDNYNDGYVKTAPVGRFPVGASPYGALDMTGNATEYVNDRYDAYAYSSMSRSNPQGPVSGDKRVRRGSSWVSIHSDLRTSTRGFSTADSLNNNVGFRCAQTE